MTTAIIKQAVLDAITGDSTFNTLTGADSDDPRLYWFYQGDALISEERPAYVTYAMTSKAEQVAAVDQPLFTFVIWARGEDLALVESIRDRFVALFEREGLTVSGETLWGTIVNEQDQYQQQPQFAGKNMVIRFGSLNLK